TKDTPFAELPSLSRAVRRVSAVSGQESKQLVYRNVRTTTRPWSDESVRTSPVGPSVRVKSGATCEGSGSPTSLPAEHPATRAAANTTVIEEGGRSLIAAESTLFTFC